MHAAAHDWIARWVTASTALNVLDIGGRNVNGHPWDLFHPESRIEVVDLIDHPSVTWVGDFLAYPTVDPFDVVLCAEVAEHTPDWRQHLRHAASLLSGDGMLVFTAAGPARESHSAVDGGPLRRGEWYENVSPDALSAALEGVYARHVIDMTPDGADVRAVAWRR